MDKHKQRKETQNLNKEKQKYSTKKPIYWHGYILSEVPYMISEARRFPEAYVISGGIYFPKPYVIFEQGYNFWI